MYDLITRGAISAKEGAKADYFFFFFSTGPPAFTQASKPPLRTFTLWKPFFIRKSAAPALEDSSGHVQ